MSHISRNHGAHVPGFSAASEPEHLFPPCEPCRSGRFQRGAPTFAILCHALPFVAPSFTPSFPSPGHPCSLRDRRADPCITARTQHICRFLPLLARISGPSSLHRRAFWRFSAPLARIHGSGSLHRRPFWRFLPLLATIRSPILASAPPAFLTTDARIGADGLHCALQVSHPPPRAHAGTVSLFERQGFAIVGRPSKKYVVMQREV